ncbi:ATP/GTP-binding protein [Enterococcus hirae]|nr:ATP/GTP-binding protein [Enterococcus hirae]
MKALDRPERSSRRRLTARGWTGRGGGMMNRLEAPPQWLASTKQAAGLWPFAIGGTTPSLGVPVGHNIRSGATVFFDPISWFEGGFIANPSLFVEGLPGLGKSTFIRRIILGLAGRGVRPLVAGDLRPDYTDLVRAIGGQVVRIGRGVGCLNPLDVGALESSAQRIGGAAGEQLRSEAHGRRLTAVSSLVLINRKSVVHDYEKSMLSTALRIVMDRRSQEMPVLGNLVKCLDEGPDEVRAVVLAIGEDNDAKYRAAVEPLHRSLIALLDGPLGEVFAGQTSTPIDLDSPGVAMDISGIPSSDSDLEAAALIACWGEAFGAMEASNALTDAGLEPQRHFLAVLDELWKAIRSGPGMVDNVDATTRLNRADGMGLLECTHTMSDLSALPDPADVAKAKGFIERAGAVAVAGLPPHEMDDLSQITHFTEAERKMVESWSTPESWDQRAEPPGLGKMLIKVGRRPGIPTQVTLTQAEIRSGVHNTNARWADRAGATQTVGA